MAFKILRSQLFFPRFCDHPEEALFTSVRSIRQQFSGLRSLLSHRVVSNQSSTSMSLRVLALLGLASMAATAPNMKPSASTVNKRYLEERNGVTYNVFQRAGETSSLSYVKNSGICETTPGVDQYSGYLDVGTNMHSKQYPTCLPLPNLCSIRFYEDSRGLLVRLREDFALLSQ